jgi:hypothetical protein
MEIVTSAVAILVGIVIYKERAINPVTISAVWLGSFLLYLLFVNHGQPLPQFLVWPLLGVTIAALVVLGRRFPMFGLFLILLINNLLRGGRGSSYYRRRWW